MEDLKEVSPMGMEEELEENQSGNFGKRSKR